MLDLERARLDAVRAFARLAAPILNSGLSLELWNGEVLPLGPAATGDVRLVVRSSRALRRLEARAAESRTPCTCSCRARRSRRPSLSSEQGRFGTS